MLRYVSPVHVLSRRTTQDVTIRGVEIPVGSSIYLLVGSVNRDAEKFPDPERLDINRPPSRTPGFGYGIHYCLGAALARMESQVAFETILQRLLDIHIAGEAPSRRQLWNYR